jgi:hypothetical protein
MPVVRSRGWPLVNASAIVSRPSDATFMYGRWPGSTISRRARLQLPLDVLVAKSALQSDPRQNT